MDLLKKLQKLGIEDVRRLSNESVRTIAFHVTEILTQTFPIIYDEYNNIFVKLLNCDMYVARITKPISRVNYIYENNSIYFDEEINLDKVNEQMIHECIHYLQDYRNKKGNLERIGVCVFNEFAVYGLGLNEAVVQYLSAKCMQNTPIVLEKYGIRIKTISPTYYPFLTNLAEQLAYLIGEEVLIKGILDENSKFEDELLNTFEESTKKIVSEFDKIVEMNNLLNVEINTGKISILQQEIAKTYIEIQNKIFCIYFNKVCPKLTTIEEIESCTNKAVYYKNLMGKIIDQRFDENFYDAYVEDLNQKLNQRLMQIMKEKSKNTLTIIPKSKFWQIIKKITAYFQCKKPPIN